MPEKHSGLKGFWTELKRRKVFGAVAPYVATAYIIIEVLNNLSGPLHLPGWIVTIVVLLLAAGLPVAVLLSWFFDFTPKGIHRTESIDSEIKTEPSAGPVKKRLKPSYILNAVLLIAVVILAYPKIFSRNSIEYLVSSGQPITIAVMPFKNMTNDTLLDIWQECIQTTVISSLTDTEELTVRQSETVNGLLSTMELPSYASLTPSFAGKISNKLDAKIFVLGSITKADTTIRINAQLIDPRTQEAFRSIQLDGTEKTIFHIMDSLSQLIKQSLIIAKVGGEYFGGYNVHGVEYSTSPEAYKCYILGKWAFEKMDFASAVDFYLQALEIDSNYVSALGGITYAYYNKPDYIKGKMYCRKYHEKKDQMNLKEKIWADLTYAILFQTPNESIKSLGQLKSIDDQNPMVYFNTGDAYLQLEQYDKAIVEFEKALEIFRKWDSKPYWIPYYAELGIAYHKSGQYKKEKKVYKRAEKDFPAGQREEIYDQQAYLFLTLGDSSQANRYLQEWIAFKKGQSWSEADISSYMSGIYDMAGMTDKAEQYMRQSLALEPENFVRTSRLASFLIDKDLNINEGIELADKVLQKNPNAVNALHAKGWAFYKQGKYIEALDLLQKSWDLRMENGIYNYKAYAHLEEAKKAASRQKS